MPSLRTDVDQRIAENMAVDRQRQKDADEYRAHIEEFLQKARNEIVALGALLEPVISEAATEGVTVKTSLDPDVLDYFLSRNGGFRLGFLKKKGEPFEPLHHNNGRESTLIDGDTLYHDATGLLIMLKKSFRGTRNLTSGEKLRDFATTAAKTLILGESSIKPAVTHKPVLLESYHQGMIFFPGQPDQDKKPWASTDPSIVLRGTEIDMLGGGFYHLLDTPFGTLPGLKLHASIEECVETFRNQIVEFLADVERKERARKSYELAQGKIYKPGKYNQA